MEEKEKEYLTNNLYMPSNISAEKEIVSGIGTKEMKHFMYLIGISLIIGTVIGIFINLQLGMIIAVAIIICLYFLVVKNPDINSSTFSQLIGIYVYYKKQNKYKYKYTEWWEMYLDEESQKTKK